MDIYKLVNQLVALEPNGKDIKKLFDKYNLNSLLPSLYRATNKLILYENVVNESRVLSPYALSGEVISKIQNKYEIKVDKFEIQNELIAGYKLYTKNKVIDNTLRNIIKKIK